MSDIDTIKVFCFALVFEPLASWRHWLAPNLDAIGEPTFEKREARSTHLHPSMP